MKTTTVRMSDDVVIKGSIMSAEELRNTIAAGEDAFGAGYPWLAQKEMALKIQSAGITVDNYDSLLTQLHDELGRLDEIDVRFKAAYSDASVVTDDVSDIYEEGWNVAGIITEIEKHLGIYKYSKEACAPACVVMMKERAGKRGTPESVFRVMPRHECEDLISSIDDVKVRCSMRIVSVKEGRKYKEMILQNIYTTNQGGSYAEAMDELTEDGYRMSHEDAHAYLVRKGYNLDS